ncbi:MAG: DUF3616 domain-containing protein [Mycetocola reblochoni]|uniref:DUF3616 domain-containing protein n=3 Tax=Mycetocola reblochoni TaxID=331618 RepID=A0A3L6ZRS6_9MICO|nr:DUF3616 domain-containing protein [Mycetocola reblochoni]RLP70577.1 DUF3616 domain-containing protein [Mycetocola reblochoni]
MSTPPSPVRPRLPRAPRPGRRLALPVLLGAALVAPFALPGAPSAAIAAGTSADPAAVDRLAVSVVGDGTGLAKTAAPVSIRLTDGTGERTGSVTLPTTGSGDGSHALTLGGTADQQGALQQSADHSVVTLGGYDAAPGSAAPNTTAAPAVPRVVGSVDAAGTVDVSTSLADAFSLRHIRGAVSVDGSGFLVAGHGGDAAASKAGVVWAPRGSSLPTPLVSGSDALNNARVPVIADGSVYVSSDRSGHAGVNLVGALDPSGTVPSPGFTLVAAAPAGAEVAHDFAFVDDELYVGYTEGSAAGIVKYVDSGSGYRAVGSYPGAFWGLTARAAGDDTVVYAVKGSEQGNSLVRLLDTGDDTLRASETVISVAEQGTAYRGVAFAPGYDPVDTPLDPEPVAPELSWTARVAGGAGGALGAVLGGDANPVARGTVTDADGREVRLTASSSDQEVVADDAIEVRRDGDAFTLAATPSAAGSATITVTASAGEGEQSASRGLALDYRVLDTPADASATVQFGMSDASAAVDVGDGHLLVADDDSNELRLFGPDGGEAVAEFDLDAAVPPLQSGEAHDLEAQARVGDTVYWVGSLGNSRSGKIRPDRDVVIRTELDGSGAATTAEVTGFAHGLRDALVDWDHAGLHGLGADRFGFAAATEEGSSAEGPRSLNVEGAAIAPDGTTLWLGFRSPLVPGTARSASAADERALIVPVADVDDVVSGAEAVVGEPILIDLGGRAIRDMVRADDDGYLILAGSADDAGDFAVFTWTGDPAQAPVRSTAPLGLEGWEGSYEAAVGVSSTADGQRIRVLQDDGTVPLYGDGTAAQDLGSTELKAFVAHDYVLSTGTGEPGGSDSDGAGAGADVDGTGTSGSEGSGTSDGTGTSGAEGTDGAADGSADVTSDDGADSSGAAPGTGGTDDDATNGAEAASPASALATTGTASGGALALAALLMAAGVLALGSLSARRSRPRG